MAEAISHDARWQEYPGEDWSDALVQSMKLGGIDHLFFVSGSEIAFWQESIAKANERGWPAPKLITVTHEAVALNAALGSAMVRNQPAATAVHVDVGTLNYGGAIHTAWRGNYPVLITAGTGPRAYPGSMAGARNSPVQWVQEPRDQGGIVRQYTKVDHRLEHQDNPGLLISRLLQISMSEPKGPAYLTVPRETAMLKLPGKSYFPTRDELGVARPAWPDPADAKRAAQWLIDARNPCIYSAAAGRNPEAVAAIVRLAELLALPLVDADRLDRLNFPTTHALYGTGPEVKDADVSLMLEALVPYISPNAAPKPGSKTIWVDADPVMSNYKTMEFQADLWLPVSVAAAAQAIHDAATGAVVEERHEPHRRAARAFGGAQARNDRAGRTAGPGSGKAQADASALGRLSTGEDSRTRHDSYSMTRSATPDLSATIMDGRKRELISPAAVRRAAGAAARRLAPNWRRPIATSCSPPATAISCSARRCRRCGRRRTTRRRFWPWSSSTGRIRPAQTGSSALIPTAWRCARKITKAVFSIRRRISPSSPRRPTVLAPPCSEPEQVGPALKLALDQVRKGTPALVAAYLPTLGRGDELCAAQ